MNEIEILETENRIIIAALGETPAVYAEIPVAVRTRFGTFREGDTIKAAKGATVEIIGFSSDATQTHVRGAKNLGWRRTITNRHIEGVAPVEAVAEVAPEAAPQPAPFRTFAQDAAERRERHEALVASRPAPRAINPTYVPAKLEHSTGRMVDGHAALEDVNEGRAYVRVSFGPTDGGTEIPLSRVVLSGYVVKYANADGESLTREFPTAAATLAFADEIAPHVPGWSAVTFFRAGDHDAAEDVTRETLEAERVVAAVKRHDEIIAEDAAPRPAAPVEVGDAVKVSLGDGAVYRVETVLFNEFAPADPWSVELSRPDRAETIWHRPDVLVCAAHYPLLLDGEPVDCTLAPHAAGTDHEAHDPEGGVLSFPDQLECWEVEISLDAAAALVVRRTAGIRPASLAQAVRALDEYRTMDAGFAQTKISALHLSDALTALMYDLGLPKSADRLIAAAGAARPEPVVEDDEDDECEGHESLAGAHMGESVFCDGSCRTAARR